ncbi:ABC transporter substrate-binding protein [Alloyangia pacifica]|uniref:ABC transporter substrate-binding protein n=1 Tax=Alloyangia pacifica TaxID=311180 RepID=UPI001CFF3849|nr:ABC transporter substrate-binding protein [Alloyangia pacifica]
MTNTLLRTGAALAALTAAMPAMAEEISMIVCGDTMNPVQQKYIDQWEAENEGWTVAPEVVGWGQCQDKVTTLAVAGTPVGLAYVGSRTLKEFAEFGLIEPVPMSDEEKASYYPNVVDTVTYQGEQWGVPVAFSTKAFYWNKDLFKEAGLDPETPPKTWAEVIDAAKAVTENTDSAGFGLVAKTFDNTMHQFLHWVYTNNGQVVDDEGNIVLNSPQNLEALEAYKALVPYSEEGPTAYEQNEVRAIFLDGGVAMMHASIGAVSRLQDTDIDWGVANLPLGPEAEGPGTLLITDSLAVFSGSGYEEKAMELAKFLTAPEAQEEYDLAEGLTPLRPSANIDALVAETPYWAPYIDGIEFGGPEPLFTDYRGFQNIMIEMVQSVVTGQAEPADALAKADEALKELE